MAERAHALVSVKTRTRDTSGSLLKVTRQCPERRNLLREKPKAALGEKVQATTISESDRIKAPIRKQSGCKRLIK